MLNKSVTASQLFVFLSMTWPQHGTKEALTAEDAEPRYLFLSLNKVPGSNITTGAASSAQVTFAWMQTL